MSLWQCYLHGLTGPTACCPSAERVDAVSSAPVPAAPAPEAATETKPLSGHGIVECRGHWHVTNAATGDHLIVPGDPFPTREAALEAADALNQAAPEAARETLADEQRALYRRWLITHDYVGREKKAQALGALIADATASLRAALAAAETENANLWQSDALEVLCRVFDDGADVAHDEWLAWYKPSEWLSPYRALGAFIRQRLATERAAAETRAEAAERALRNIRDNYDHEQQTHDHQPFVYGGTCRACLAARTLDAARAARPEGREG